MKIMQIIPDFGIGGAESMCRHLSVELKDSGNDVSVYCFYEKDNKNTDLLKSSGFKINCLEKHTGFDIKIILKLRKIIKKIQPDVLHTHLYVLPYVFFASIGTGAKIVHTVHSVAQKECGKFNQLLNKLFLKGKRVVFVALSNNIQETICGGYKLNKEKAPVVFNGAPMENCLIKTNYNIKEYVTIFHVARFQPVKNHISLLTAIKILKEKGIFCKLLLCGDGECREQIEQFIQDNKLQSEVSLCGFRSDLEQVLSTGDIFVLPSLYEGVPLTIIEAMASGLPIVASNVGGILDMINHEENGLLCEPTAESIAINIERFINDEKLRESCGKNALTDSKRFSSQIMAEQYFKIYSQKF